MAEFAPFSTLRNALLYPIGKLGPIARLTPLTRGRSEDLTDLPAHSATSTVSRHDHHNVEVKTVSELGSQPSVVETDLYLYVPRSFEISSVGKSELIKDFRTRIRLALPSTGDLGAAAFESALEQLAHNLKALEESEKAGEHIADLNSLLSDSVLENVKNLCAILSGTLKHGASEHCRQFLLSHTLMATQHQRLQGLETLGKQVATTQDMVDRARKVAVSGLQSAATVFAFFDEFMSQLYVQYLSAVRSEIERIGMPKPEVITDLYKESRKRLEKILDGYQEREARHRVRFSSGDGTQYESDLERERRLVRMSHLKKFFQSNTFIDVSRKESAKKITESTATIGTAMAALIAALLESYSRSNVANFALNGMLVIGFGVIFYTLRDRLKDRAKTHFQERALKMFPDYEQALIAGDRKIGTAKEWFHLMSQREVPEEVRDLRRSASVSEMEKRLPEDIFHCRKVQEVAPQGIENAKAHLFSQALHENTRINFERYLKHMDDPFKEIIDLDTGGQFRKVRSHRVYHFYLCVKTITRPLSKKSADTAPRREQTLVYRIILDKRGVVRIENLGA